MNANGRPDEVSPEQRGPDSGAPAWWIYRGTGRPLPDLRMVNALPEPPPWRDFTGELAGRNDVPPPAEDDETSRRLGRVPGAGGLLAEPTEIDIINAAIYLRRPLLITGPPGAGKSTTAFQIAHELRLGRVIRWHVTSHTTLKTGLYTYDAIGRAEAVAARQAETRWASADQWSGGGGEPPRRPGGKGSHEDVGAFVRLGALGTAFLPSRVPRVLLIDELDKSEADLPNDLLQVFEEGSFPIPELERVRGRQPQVEVFTDDPDRTAVISGGRVRCRAFPIVVITSNGERTFPPAFLRRCLQLDIPAPTPEKLATMAAAHLHKMSADRRSELVTEFVRRNEEAGVMPADRLLDAMFLATQMRPDDKQFWSRLLDALWNQLKAGA